MTIKLQPVNEKRIEFGVVGISPLVMHAWSIKGIKQMRMTAIERRKQPKVARDPEGEMDEATYKKDGKVAFPLLSLKASMIAAAHKDIGIEKTMVRKAFFLECDNPERLVDLEHSEAVMREDVVRVGVSQTDLRYRPMFEQWKFRVSAIVDYDLLNESNVVNLVNRAGFSCGVGEMRPERGGEFGRFKVGPEVEVVVSNP